MDLNFAPEDVAFREQVRTFIAENYPEHLRGKNRRAGLEKDDFLAWHRILHKQGWVAPSWPKEYGGTGWTVTQKYIWGEECATAEVLPVLPFGVNMLGPVIYTFASEDQKKHYLPRILSGEDWWCQGYSEPGSGSDLASLRTKAVRDGDHYIVNGSKTWTTLAQHADWIFCLVKTNTEVKAQEGISFLLMDIKTPGITVRPIITMDGSHEVNEVFLEDVKVPVENLVGEENKGWTYAKFLLGHERSGIAGVAGSKRQVEKLKTIAGSERSGTGTLMEDTDFARKVAELEVDLLALEFTELRTLASESAGKGPGPEASLLKVKGTEVQQRLTDMTLEAVGYYGFPFVNGPNVEGSNIFPVGPDYATQAGPTYFNHRKASIYGGSNEIQRNIMAKMVLGL